MAAILATVTSSPTKFTEFIFFAQGANTNSLAQQGVAAGGRPFAERNKIRFTEFIFFAQWAKKMNSLA